MNQQANQESLAFFLELHQVFSDTLSEYRGRNEMLPALLTQGYESFEANVEYMSEELPEVACHKGCATCCTVRVVATAPEVLLATRYVRAAEKLLKQKGIDLRQRLRDADDVTRGHGEKQRVKLRKRCPFIDKGACVIYPVRPLACRGHASYDKQACVDAARGKRRAIPYSLPHMNMRSLIQNAMQAALRDADYSWANYELNHAMSIALDDENCETEWYAGADVFSPALVEEVSLSEMAIGFDQILGRTVQ